MRAVVALLIILLPAAGASAGVPAKAAGAAQVQQAGVRPSQQAGLKCFYGTRGGVRRVRTQYCVKST